MRKILSTILALLIACSSVISLSSCGATKESQAMTMGQWVTLIADAFGMQNYTQAEPYFAKVDKDDSCFSAFQTCVEWDVLAPSDTITSETPVKWNDVYVSLVNAGAFLDVEAPEKEKVEYAVENFSDTAKKYWGNRYISISEAIPLLDAAQELWANKEFTEKIEKADFGEKVKNNITDEDFEYSQQDNDTITMPLSQFEDMQVGDVYTLPANENNDASINRIASYEVIGDQVKIVNDSNFTEEEAAEYIQEVKIQETSAVDFSKMAGIYDEFGNPIAYTVVDEEVGAEGTSTDFTTPEVNALGKSSGNQTANGTGLFDNVKGALTFKVGDYSVSISTKSNNFSVKLEKTLTKTSNRYRSEKTTAFVSTSFDNMKLTKDIDYSWGKLHAATIKLDYKTTIEGGIEISREQEIGKPSEFGQKTITELATVINQYKDALANINTDVRNSKCDDDIYICRIPFVEGGFASLDFIVKGKVEASGELKIVVEVQGAQGIEYKNGNFRYIKSDGVDVDFIADAKIEVTIGPGVAIQLFKKIALIEIMIDVGVGAAVEFTAHLFDAEGHELYSTKTSLTSEDADKMADDKALTSAEDILAFAESQGGTWKGYQKGMSVALKKGNCMEWKLYPILKIGIDGSSLVGKLAKSFKVTLTVQFLGENSDFGVIKGHIDYPNNITNMINSGSVGGGFKAFLGIGADCVYEYKPWDDAIEKAEDLDGETGDTDYEIPITEKLQVSTIRLFIEKGEKADLRVTGIPEGYTLSDIEVESLDESIAKFDIYKGEVIAQDESGVTALIIQTKDKKHRAFCAITVNESSDIDFSGLEKVTL